MQVAPGELMYQYLAEMTYPDSVPKFPHGKSIMVVKSASYANYLETNGLIVAAKDDAAAAALATAYPGRSVVQIDVSAINYAGGGIHYCTQQQPTGSVE